MSSAAYKAPCSQDGNQAIQICPASADIQSMTLRFTTCEICEGLCWVFLSPSHPAYGFANNWTLGSREWIGPCPLCCADDPLEIAAQQASGSRELVAWALAEFDTGTDNCVHLPWPFVRCVCPEYDGHDWTYSAPDDGGAEKLQVALALELAEIIVDHAALGVPVVMTEEESAAMEEERIVLRDDLAIRVKERRLLQSIPFQSEVYVPVPGSFAESLVGAGATLVGGRRAASHYLIAVEYAPADSVHASPGFANRLYDLSSRWEHRTPTPFRRRLEPVDLITAAVLNQEHEFEIIDNAAWESWYAPLAA
jgi:hypothetical protein